MLKISETRYFTVSELAEKSELPESTVRYYLKNVLNEYLARQFPRLKPQQGKTGHYPVEVLDRLRFVRMAKKELERETGNSRSPTVSEIKFWMESISDEQIRAVLKGEDVIEFDGDQIKDEIRQVEKREARAEKTRDPEKKPPREHQVIEIAPGIEIRHPEKLSPRQRQLMAPIKKLLKLVFEGE